MTHASSTAAEKVILLNDAGEAIGEADKSTVHGVNTPLHLAFSCHVFDEEGLLLVTRRALSKRTWPGVWTNSFCGHPAPDETVTDALVRRGQQELGIDVHALEAVLPDFRYRATDAAGAVENEVCPVFTATTADPVRPAANEVAEWRWVDPSDLVTAVECAPWAFSPWLTLQLPLLYTD